MSEANVIPTISAGQACMVCEAIHGKTGLIIFENDEIMALMDENPASTGQIAVMPKQHFTIIEQIPDYLVNDLFLVSNRLSMILFEALQIQGTNVLVHNGVAAGQSLPHFLVNIIPRKEGDNINFQWQPKQLSEEEMSTVELVLKEQTQGIGNFEKRQKEEIIVLDKEPEEKIQDRQKEDAKGHENTHNASEEENYMIKHLRRIA